MSCLSATLFAEADVGIVPCGEKIFSIEYKMCYSNIRGEQIGISTDTSPGGNLDVPFILVAVCKMQTGVKKHIRI